MASLASVRGDLPLDERGKALSIAIDAVESPVGRVVLAVSGGRLCALGFEDYWSTLQIALRRRLGAIDFEPRADPEGFSKRLRSYFQGELTAIDSIPVDLHGTAFQRNVWTALRRIPCGETRSYGELARMIEAPDAVRAVGAANGQNPISIVVPCHRVIGADGKLTGYGGGIERKRWLLAHEKVLLT